MKIVTRSPAQEAAIDAAIAHLELIIAQKRARIEIQVAVVDAAAIINAPATTENTYSGNLDGKRMPRTEWRAP